MRYEYTETQPEFRIPNQETRNRPDPASDIPAEILEDTEDIGEEPIEYPDIPEDTEEADRTGLTEAPEIPEDTETADQTELTEVPEIPEDTEAADQTKLTEVPEIPEDTEPYRAKSLAEIPEIPEDTETEPEIPAGSRTEIPADTTGEYMADSNAAASGAMDIQQPEETDQYAQIGEWPKADDAIPIDVALSDANPGYGEGEEWQVNCQRCVPTYEMRRRGFDVSATPCGDDLDHLSYNPFDVWKEPDIIFCPDDDESYIIDEMSQWEDGARAQVAVMWAQSEGGHTFTAEKINGEIRFMDPQTGDAECSEYFDETEPGTTQFCRIDNLQPSERVLECCKEAGNHD